MDRQAIVRSTLIVARPNLKPHPQVSRCRGSLGRRVGPTRNGASRFFSFLRNSSDRRYSKRTSSRRKRKSLRLLLPLPLEKETEDSRPSKLQQSSIRYCGSRCEDAREDAIPAGAKGRVSVRSRLCRRNLCESAGPTESAAGASVGPGARVRGRRAITRIVYAGAPRGYLIRRARGSNLSGGQGGGGGGSTANATFVPPQDASGVRVA